MEQDSMKMEQMSIYDFLQDGESQEVAPSETLPQVDEAQETVEFYADGKLVAKQTVPSSALDVVSDLNIKAEPKEVFEISTEDTDKTLFSVGDKALVRNACEVYNADEDIEDYYSLLDHQGKVVVISEVHPNNYFIVADGINFYATELQKI